MLAPVKTMSLPEKMSEIGPKPLMSIGRGYSTLTRMLLMPSNYAVKWSRALLSFRLV
jgi:hypothetical protein